ncbi:MAG: adenylate/guanylate cyclase domain-containing protein, partial [Rhodobacteraceae bacterium]|nr:adenylate/guanylate cyclase domain-containing protein [Paracoccaceae bacterium]
MTERDVKRRLTTILAADVVGYSRLMAGDEPGTLADFKATQAEIVYPQAEDHRGRVVNIIGDSMLLEFTSVVDAVNCAMAIQQAISARNEGVSEDKQFLLRIGVNIGDVIVDGETIFGNGVNVASRLESLAHTGGVCISRTVLDQIKGKVPFSFEDMGKQSVKNIPDPVQVFRVLNEVPTTGQQVIASSKKSALRWPLATTICAAFAIVAAVVFWQRPWAPHEEPAIVAEMAFPLPDKPSIAVLPFDELSENASQEYFADGMTEDLITDLSKISGLFVIARNSSFAYKGKSVNVKDVAEELGVRFVLEGSVRRAGDKLRVNAQLIDAITGGHVWADRFDGQVENVFELQDKFVLQITSALELELSDGERGEIEKTETQKVAAREAFQRGWELYSRFNEPDNATSVRHFEKAIELDPEYGRAYGALALVYQRDGIFRWNKVYGRSRQSIYTLIVPELLRKAQKQQPALVHIVNAMRYLNLQDQNTGKNKQWRIEEAQEEAAKAIALQPNDPEAHITMAWALIAAGKPTAGLEFVRTAERLNPNYPSHYVLFKSAAHIGIGDLKQAAEVLKHGLNQNSQATALAPLAASVNALLGRRQEANRAVAMWLSFEEHPDLQEEVASYRFPVTWAEEYQELNQRLMNGLRLAAIPLNVTVTSLMTDLKKQELKDQFSTIRTLGLFGTQAVAAVPDLIEILGGTNKKLRREAAVTLGKIGPDAKAAIPALEA